MSQEFFEELTSQIIETSKWDKIPEGIIGSIEFMTSHKLARLKNSISSKDLYEMVLKAKKNEEFIIEYLEMKDDFKIKSDFKITFPIGKESIMIQSEFYKSIFNLYFLRNPDLPQKMIESWITEKKNVTIEFGFNNEKNEFFIRRINIHNSNE